MMLFVLEVNKMFTLVLILHMDSITVIGKPNVFNYIVRLVGQLKKQEIHYFMEIQEYYQSYTITSLEQFVMMVSMIILLPLPVSNCMVQAQPLFRIVMGMFAIIKTFG